MKTSPVTFQKVSSVAKLSTPTPKKGEKEKTYTMAVIFSAVTTAGKVNGKKGVKSFYTNDGAKLLAKAIAKAMNSDAMTDYDVTTSKSVPMAKRRRELAKTLHALALDGNDILLKNTTDRTENAFHMRLRSIEKVLGLGSESLYAIRANSYKKGEKSPVYILRR